MSRWSCWRAECGFVTDDPEAMAAHRWDAHPSRGQHRRVRKPYEGRPGCCPWCGEASPVRLRRDGLPALNSPRWHPACVEAYNALQPAAWRTRVYREAMGLCADCGRFCPQRPTIRVSRDPADDRSRQAAFYRDDPEARYRRWHADHIVPLADGGDWSDENGQLLCEPCHKAKTAREAAERAARRVRAG